MLTADELKAQVIALKPEGVDEAKWGDVATKFIALHDTEVSGLKNNEAALKQEKVELANKYRAEKADWEKSSADYTTAKADWDKALQDNTAKYEARIAELDKKIAANQPDEIKKLYEARQKELSAAFDEKNKNLTSQLEALKQNYEASIKERDAKLATLEEGVFQRDCLEAFNKAIAGKNIDPTMLDLTRTLVLGTGCNYFSKKDLGNGNYIITRNDGKDIDASVTEFLASEAGKRFVLNTNTGGGADGSKAVTSKQKMTRSLYESLPPDKQAEALKNYTIE